MVGRPSKVDQWLTEDGLSLLTSWKKAGLTDAEIAQKIGISETTMKTWKRRFPPVSAAFKKGLEHCIADAEEALYSKFKVQTLIEEKEEIWQNEDGEFRKHKIITKRQIAPDTTAVIFFLKTKAGYKDITDVKIQAISNERRKELDDYFGSAD